MAIGSVLSTAASGLRASALRASSAANNIANVNTAGYTASRVSQSTIYAGGSNHGGGALTGDTGVSAQLLGGGGPPDLGTEILRLVEAEAVYKANAEVLRTAQELTKRTLDIVG